MAKTKAKSRLTTLTGSGKKKTAMKLAAKYRLQGLTPRQALKKAWTVLREGKFLE